MRALIPKPLMKLMEELYDEEGALLLGKILGESIVLEGMAFTPCEVWERGFECLPYPMEDLIGVFHKHREEPSERDLRIATLWPLYVVLSGKGLMCYNYGKLVEALIV